MSSAHDVFTIYYRTVVLPSFTRGRCPEILASGNNTNTRNLIDWKIQQEGFLLPFWITTGPNSEKSRPEMLLAGFALIWTCRTEAQSLLQVARRLIGQSRECTDVSAELAWLPNSTHTQVPQYWLSGNQPKNTSTLVLQTMYTSTFKAKHNHNR